MKKIRRTGAEMASRNGKRVRRPHPMAVMTAGTVLLLGWHMRALLNDIPRERVAAYPPQTLPPAPLEPPVAKTGSAAPISGPSAPVTAGAKIDGPKLAEKAAPLLPLSLSPPALLPANGETVPVHGPQWQHA